MDASPGVDAVLLRLEEWGAAHDWVGADPYEGLNASLGRIAKSARARQAVVQAYKRSPLPPPWPLRAEPQPNAKALALALGGYATPRGRELPASGEMLRHVPGRLAALNLGSTTRTAWGYPFDAQTRHLFYRRTIPNAIATCFVVNALCDGLAATRDGRLAEAALCARPYLLSLLHNAPGYGAFFAYVESGSELIHNANVMVCGTLARLHRLDPDEGTWRIVCEAAETTISRQRSDGLWDYGEASNLRWADNFHTAYILEGLCQLETSFGVGSAALDRGARAWRERFFDASGWARYVPDGRYPLETHSCASAIDLLCTLAGQRPDVDHIAFAERVAATAIRELWMSRPGCFAFKRTALGLNRRQFVRWTNAPMFRALANLCSHRTGS